MPCVYLPGPAPAVTVANTNPESNHQRFYLLKGTVARDFLIGFFLDLLFMGPRFQG